MGFSLIFGRSIMAFYEDISAYYDYIFPTGKEQLNFICEVAGKPPRDILDIACGTGGYSIKLADMGYTVTATDIDRAMVESVRNKINNSIRTINCVQAGMLDLKEKLTNKYDLAFCIGNSIVHLKNKEEILLFLISVKDMLKRDGSLIIQVINYDRILLKDIRELPVITNDETGLKFERYYEFDRENGMILFRTVLSVDNRKIENEIPLFPLTSDDAMELFNMAGYKKVKQFGNFNGDQFDKYNSYMMVLWAL
jgi:SAM-dependent methyltransferase